MRDLIAENAKFVLDYGPYFLIAGILICLFIIILIVRKQKRYLPKNIPGWIASILSILLIIVLSMTLAGLIQEKKTTGKVLDQFELILGKEAPMLTFQDVENDSSMRLEDFKGKIVLLNLWATWCAPCLQEMPDLNRIQQEYAEDGLIVIALSDEKREKLLNYHVSHPGILLSVYNRQIEWLEMKIGSGRPITFIIDRNGIIKEYHTGARDYEFFATKLNELL